jgi:chitodextrinase
VCGTTYSLAVDAFDGAGNVSFPASLIAATSPCPDTSAPTMPTGLKVTAATTDSVAASWVASTDNVAVTGYDLFLNGTKVGSTTATLYSFSGLACSTSYTIGVQAFDGAGNRSQRASLTVATSTCPDTTAPTAPTYLLVSAATATSIAAFWDVSFDDVGVAGYDVFVNGTKTGSTTTTSYTFGGLTCGTTYVLGVKAFDAAGNRSALTSTSAATAACPVPAGGLHVSGNQLLDASGGLVRLHGVNYSGTEYACIQGWGIFDGPSDAASVSAIRSWNSNVVHVGLNEDCILGINGVAAAYSGTSYMNAIVAYVNALHAQGLFAEVSLMWAAPGTQKALDHPLILDADHAPAALKAIANAFKGDPNTFIGLQSEPHGISWACWKNGGSSCSVGYTALGMQGALDAVRSTGAANVVTVSGIDYANNLSQWLANKPSDPLNQLMAEAHVYGGNSCASTTCFNTNYAPVAASVPVVFGETGETYDDSSCGSTNISTFMNWADAHNVGYEAWTWDTWGTCGSLISNFNGTPANNYGTWVRGHYLSLP